jgi:hypothetical protein
VLRGAGADRWLYFAHESAYASLILKDVPHAQLQTPAGSNVRRVQEVFRDAIAHGFFAKLNEWLSDVIFVDNATFNFTPYVCGGNV